MTLRLADNEWGFSIAENNPFRIFRMLQSTARATVGEDTVIDLSRGDPGYGFTPSVRGRQFFAYMVFLDSKFNTSKQRVVLDFKEENWDVIWTRIEDLTRAEYGTASAQRNLRDLKYFLEEVTTMGRAQGLQYSPYQVLFGMLKYANVSGGNYHNPVGEEVCRVIVAWWHQKTVATSLDYNDVIFVSGASHAIGGLFKMLGEEGIGYLRERDRALITSPVYAPYNGILESRGVDVFSLELDPFTGKISQHSMDEMKNDDRDVKVILLIDPNNPTGFSMDVETLEEIGAYAKRKDCLIITDEVYNSFFEDKKTMIDICPERTIMINARSKIERSTGLRYGDVTVTKEGQKYIMENLFAPYLSDAGERGNSWTDLFRAAKAPGGILGEFQHTTFVPGPAQFLGSAHIVLGEKEREEYKEAVAGNMKAFTETLGLPHDGNMYYIIFDLNEVKGATKAHVPAEEKLLELAKRGVVFIPSNLFFSQRDRDAKDRRNTVRASVVNTSLENVKKAAEITRAYLTE
jgi:aspartate/methionine/tyrosine aminotransferase